MLTHNLRCLLRRRGGCAIKKSCEAAFDAQTGWSEMFLTTPSAPIKGCLRRHFLDVASTPPLEEGTSSNLTVSPFGTTSPSQRPRASLKQFQDRFSRVSGCCGY